MNAAGIDGRMKTIIPRPVVNSPHCPAGFSFLFSFIVSLYEFDSGCSDSIGFSSYSVLIISVIKIGNWF